ncbi:tetratricopeptide repeat protein [Methanothermobacter sp. KEPCO-1]|nr:tetratricopeptide repeat protein [Methanobacteriales archaeon]MBC7118891.1 tetratricopeptide repeat protein [Methanobacteriaceae archaeon]QEF94659.1 tetratricopeptide repeat protein [Methanothermobacter sp. KEPCO-1]QHN07799.1 tetratricopeptide repeat protein [Methanothermobacter sp. THM-2]
MFLKKKLGEIKLDLNAVILFIFLLSVVFIFIEYSLGKIALGLIEKEEYEKAINVYRLLISKTEKDLFNIGFCFTQNKEYQKALKYYDKALKINPEYAEAWNNKGIILKELKKYKKALKCYNKALEINPELIEAWNNKGTTLQELGKYEEALECYNKALEINQKSIETLTYKGITLSKIGKYKKALKCFDKALKIDPKNKLLHKTKAALHKKLKNQEKA